MFGIKWRKKCNHNYRNVLSTGKTHDEILKEISKTNPYFKIIILGTNNISLRYKDHYIYSNTLYSYNYTPPSKSKIYNLVCIECGCCLDMHKRILDEILEQKRDIDKTIEELDFAEKIWKECKER